MNLYDCELLFRSWTNRCMFVYDCCDLHTHDVCYAIVLSFSFFLDCRLSIHSPPQNTRVSFFPQTSDNWLAYRYPVHTHANIQVVLRSHFPFFCITDLKTTIPAILYIQYKLVLLFVFDVYARNFSLRF